MMSRILRSSFGGYPLPAFICGVLLAVGTCAQDQRSKALGERPPFEDPVLHAHMVRILHHMDGFNADSSMFWISKALKHIDPTTNREALYYLLTYRAEVLYYEGLFNEAILDLDKSASIAQRMEDSLLIANLYNLKGLLHENIQESKEALPYMRMALAWFPSDPSARYPVTELHHIHGNLGSYLMLQGMLDSSGYHLARSLELAEAAHAARATAVAHWSLGALALRKAMPDSALSCYERVISLARGSNEFDVMLDGYSGLAEAYAVLGSKKKALHALAMGEAHALEHPNSIGLVTRRNYARRSSSVLRSLGEADHALSAIAAWHQMDSAISAKNTRTALRTQAELLRSDKDLALERVQSDLVAKDLERVRTTRTIMLVAGALLLLVLSGLILVNASRRKHERRLAVLEMARLQQDALIVELRIREQVGRDMHDDLGAGLSALKLKSEMALRNASDQAQKHFLGAMSATAGELIASMRQIIWALSTDQGTVEDLVVYIGNYTRTYLDEHGVRAIVSAPEEWPAMQLATEQRRNLFLVVKEALHNIIKHAQAEEVTVSFSNDAGIRIVIRDNGVGLARNAELGVGNGIRNMTRRMTTIAGTIEISNIAENGGKTGTQLVVHLPFACN